MFQTKQSAFFGQVFANSLKLPEIQKNQSKILTDLRSDWFETKANYFFFRKTLSFYFVQFGNYIEKFYADFIKSNDFANFPDRLTERLTFNR